MGMARQLQRLRGPIFIVVVLLLLALVLEIGFYLGQHAAFSGLGTKCRQGVGVELRWSNYEFADRNRLHASGCWNLPRHCSTG